MCMPFVLSFNVTKALYPLNQAKYVSRISSALVRNRQDETEGTMTQERGVAEIWRWLSGCFQGGASTETWSLAAAQDVQAH